MFYPYDESDFCIADIKNMIYEAGIFRPEEDVVLVVGPCVLLEHFTGKVYSYRMVDLHTLKIKRLFSRRIPLAEDGYQRAMEKMAIQMSRENVHRPDIPIEGNILQDSHGRAVNLLTHIFHHILPEHGMALRESQLSLSLAMLEAMEKSQAALCEAEVGTGKTHAYLMAAVVYRLFHGRELPVIISSSTIALQKALTEEYIPQISEILLEHHIIEEPLTFAVRKGKSHYACDSRVKTYLSSISHNKRPEDKQLIGILTAIFVGASSLDLDDLPLTDYVKERICVENCRNTCEYAGVCRYRTFLRRSNQGNVDFQIANHNLVLADVLSRKGGRNRLLPEHGILIFDEAHKLPETARQMYGISIENVELERVASSITRAVANRSEKREALRLCGEMLELNMTFFENIKNSAGMRYQHNCVEVILTPFLLLPLKVLSVVIKSLSALFYTADRKNMTYKRIFNRLNQKQEKLLAFFDYAEFICYLEYTEVACRLCALPKQLDFLLHEDLWSNGKPYLLTSATLSVGGDFSHYMHQTGIDLLSQKQVLTVRKASPFDYRNHALLYLPKDMPFPNIKKKAYRKAVADKLEELFRQSHGHTLVLFTSYRMMEMVCQELTERIEDFPLFFMGKGRLEDIRKFRNSKNGVLFASDSAGEGIDLAGDILSSLVVVKLPFPMPDPVLEYEKSLYGDFHEYLAETIVPGMLMKLRQWIGRGIRRETDTCVFSILDCRAGRRYKNDILAALPDMPITDRIEDVGIFIRNHKPESYFMDGE